MEDRPTTDKPEPMSDTFIAASLFLAFILGGGAVLIVALVGRVDTLRDQLQREREGRQPTVVVVRD